MLDSEITVLDLKLNVRFVFRALKYYIKCIHLKFSIGQNGDLLK